jgi:hypothetical protein
VASNPESLALTTTLNDFAPARPVLSRSEGVCRRIFARQKRRANSSLAITASGAAALCVR